MEAFFLHIRQNRNSTFISCTLKGAKRWYRTPLHRKTPLSLEDLKFVYDDLKPSSDHDNLLFLSQLLAGFHILLCLAKLCFLDNIRLCDYSKISFHSSICWLYDTFSFLLHSHKADSTFEGSHLIVQKVHNSPTPILPFQNIYIHTIDFSHSIPSYGYSIAAKYPPVHGSPNALPTISPKP